MTTEQTFVIVGASLAGAKAAETLRSEGFDGRLVLIGAEHERPYERPPLSKDYLRGESAREQLYVHGEGFYAEQDIELRLGCTACSTCAASGTRTPCANGSPAAARSWWSARGGSAPRSRHPPGRAAST